MLVSILMLILIARSTCLVTDKAIWNPIAIIAS